MQSHLFESTPKLSEKRIGLDPCGVLKPSLNLLLVPSPQGMDFYRATFIELNTSTPEPSAMKVHQGRFARLRRIAGRTCRVFDRSEGLRSQRLYNQRLARCRQQIKHESLKLDRIGFFRNVRFTKLIDVSDRLVRAMKR
jgi:hypothetical protein